MDHRIRHRDPYAAVLFLAEWAADHWEEIDATCALTSGIDPIDLPNRRIVNLAKRLFLDTLVPEARERISLLLDFPEVREERETALAEQQRAQRERDQSSSVERSAATLHVNVEKMYERAARARAAGLAELERRRREAESQPPEEV